MTIATVSEKVGISADTLRYYERIGLIPTVRRNKSGNREYTEEDCSRVEFIKCMRDSGLSIKRLMEYFYLFQQGDRTIERRRNLLIEHRKNIMEKIEEMKKTVERLDGKISRYGY